MQNSKDESKALETVGDTMMDERGEASTTTGQTKVVRPVEEGKPKLMISKKDILALESMLDVEYNMAYLLLKKYKNDMQAVVRAYMSGDLSIY